MLCAPILNFVSPPPPTCSLTVSTPGGEQTGIQDTRVLIRHGSEIHVTWTSTGAKTAESGESVPLALSGTLVYAPSATTTYSYIFTRGNARAVCSFTATIEPEPVAVATSTPPVIAPVQKPVVPPVIVPPPAPPVPPPATTTQNIAIGSTTLVVADIPLLSGGTAHAGEAVPVSYLQITNTGTAYAKLNGFWLHQDGSANTSVVIGLSTIDDMGGSQGLAGGVEGASPFNAASGFAPTSALFAPGQMRLFTVKAILSGNVSAYLGTQLQLNVTSIDSTATAKGTFPIHGTTWVIAP